MRADAERSNPAAQPPSDTPALPRRRRYLLSVLLVLVAGPVLLLAVAWQALAVYYSNLPGPLRPVGAVVVIALPLLILIRIRPWYRAAAVMAAQLLLVASWWALIPASHDRNWQVDVTQLPWAEINGDRVTLHRIRNCDYRSETDFDVGYYDAEFDLSQLRSVDLVFCQWGPQLIAHTMMSFGFEGDRYVCCSVETRKQLDESYSTVKGFFKQYELIYVLADERDLIRLRTNYRDEDVSLFRLRATPEIMRGVFLNYLAEVNALHKAPQWYNALTSNCTTNIRNHTQPYAHGTWDWRLLVNGHLPELLYERGAVDTSLSLQELIKRSSVNSKALEAGNDADFSQQIRVGLPGISASPEPSN